MKKNLSFLILGLLMYSTIGSVVAPGLSHSDIKSINESILISKPVIKDENEFVSINLRDGNSYLLNPGKPMLPVVNQVFVLPFGSKIYSADVIYSGENEISLSKKVKPAVELIPLGSPVKIEKDMEIYDNSEIFPQERFTYRTGSGVSDGRHVLFLTVQCYPIKYNPLENILYYCDSIDVYVSYYGGITFSSTTDKYDLVVISSATFSSSIQKLIDHKNNHGVKTFFKDVNEIYNTYPGRDKQEKIKYYIKDAIETFGISYVLLVGSIDHVPIRNSHPTWEDNTDLDCPSDHYYADIYDSDGNFCSWDANDNDIFGEYNWKDGNIDDVDLYADVSVGRIPCLNNRDLNIVINKIINYENNAHDKSWYDRILLLGGDTFPSQGINEGELINDLIAKEMDNFTAIRLWTSKGNFNPLNINFQTSLGASFISYSGHGYEHGFGTSPPNEEKIIKYRDIYLFGMLNGNKLPIFFLDTCLTATLDDKLFNFISYPGFAYSIVKKPFGGAVASIGATRISFGYMDENGDGMGCNYLNLHFFMNYEEGITIGEMFNKAQNDHINYVDKDFLTLEEFIIVGDPSLKTG
jgi:hypothetical protein